MTERFHQVRIKNGLFAQCEECKLWVEIPTSGFIPLMSHHSTVKWLCDRCWDKADSEGKE